MHNFYPRPPRGGRRWSPACCRSGWYFYPRPPRGGRRLIERKIEQHENFYPRPPRGGRQVHDAPVCGRTGISIHALREEGDRRRGERLDTRRISIHALREEGDIPPASRGQSSHRLFLSTPSARRATGGREAVDIVHEISIHALREEGDHLEIIRRQTTHHISIHALREEGDPAPRRPSLRTGYFYPRPPRGGRPNGRGRRLPCW